MQLLSSPEVRQLAAKSHSVMRFAAGVLTPGVATGLLEPQDTYLQVVALLLLAWVLLGWVIPTLLLLPPAAVAPGEAAAPAVPAAALETEPQLWRQSASQPSSSRNQLQEQQSQPPSGSAEPAANAGPQAAAKPASRLIGAAERVAAVLECRLRSLSWRQQRQQPALELSLPTPVAWLGTVSCAWICCCCAAQLYASSP